MLDYVNYRPPAVLGAAAADQADDGDEQRRSDDRPDDGEGLAADGDREELREMEGPREPGSDEGADEPEGDRDETPPAGAAADGLTERSADPGDHEQQEELEQGHRALPPRVPRVSRMGQEPTGMGRSKRGAYCWAPKTSRSPGLPLGRSRRMVNLMARAGSYSTKA